MPTAILIGALFVGVIALVGGNPWVMVAALLALAFAIAIMIIDLATIPPRKKNLF